MTTQKLDTNWRFGALGTTDGVPITLPHDAMLLESRSPDHPGGVHIAWHKGGEYWYERVIHLDENALNDHLLLEFEGVYHHAEVFLNGCLLATHAYGYTGFDVCLDGHAHPGDNLLRVQVHNAKQPNSRWYTGSGIYRPVWLHRMPRQHILRHGVQISTLDHEKRMVEGVIRTTASGLVDVCFFDQDTPLHRLSGESTNGEFRFVCCLPGAALWSPEAPRCYTCRVRFGEDEQSVRFGIRTVTCNAEGGLCINGQRTVLLGACVHHDNGLLGACAYEYAERRKVRLLKEAGFNAIRSSHNPCSKAMLDACDDLGMLLVDEFADQWYIHKSQYDYADSFLACWREDLTSMVLRDVNHPSVIMWSIGNEVSETAQERGIVLTADMVEHVRSLDDTRPITCGINIFFNYLSSLGFGVYSDKKAAKAAKKGGHQPVGSEFFNMISGLLGDRVMKLGATLPGSDHRTRDAFAKLDVAGYNYGTLRYQMDLKKYPKRVILGSETLCKDVYRNIALARKHPAIIGDFVWTGIDYLGESALGACEFRDYARHLPPHAGWLTSGCGCLDLHGEPTGEMDYLRVAYGLERVRLAVVPMGHGQERPTPSAWRMTNARRSWTWNGCEGQTAQVEVYADADHVELLLNGRPQGSKRMNKDGRVILKCPYAPGRLEAIAYDRHHHVLGRDTLITAAPEICLHAQPEQAAFAPDDLVYVHFHYADASGTVHPLARGEIHLQVTGGQLLGFGHACPYNEQGYGAATSDTYFGAAMAIIRPTAETICLQADSPYGSCSTELAQGCAPEG